MVLKVKNINRVRFIKRFKLEKEITLLKKNLDDVYLHSVELYSLAGAYQEVLNQVYFLFKSLDIKDCFDIYVVYDYLLKNGYLSSNHDFSCCYNVLDSIPLFGVNVIEGAGSCRHIASFLTDIYKRFGFVSVNMSMYLPSENFSLIDSSDIMRGKFNHLVSLVRNDKGTLLFDALNDYVFFVWNGVNVSPVGFPNVLIYCQYEGIFNRYLSCSKDSIMGNTDKEVVLGLEDRYQVMLDFCRNHGCYFDEFYSFNRDLYHDVLNKKKLLYREFSSYVFPHLV